MKTPLGWVRETTRNLSLRRSQPLFWLAVPVALLLLGACTPEAVQDHKVTPAPTSPEAAAAPTEHVSEQAKEPTAAIAVQAEVQPTEATPSEPSEPSDAAGLEIGVPGDALQFDKSTLSADSGAEVVVVFKNGASALQHNWVLVKTGSKDEIATAGMTAGLDNDWVPSGDDRVIAHSGLVDAGGSEEIRFTAPAAGAYQFVCTFPGHNFTMFGDFEVK